MIFFQMTWKLQKLVQFFLKNDSSNKENNRPMSVFFHMSKVFEKIMHNQIESFMEDQYCLQNSEKKS